MSQDHDLAPWPSPGERWQAMFPWPETPPLGMKAKAIVGGWTPGQLCTTDEGTKAYAPLSDHAFTSEARAITACWEYVFGAAPPLAINDHLSPVRSPTGIDGTRATTFTIEVVGAANVWCRTDDGKQFVAAALDLRAAFRRCP